jgi:hypothetical protein
MGCYKAGITAEGIQVGRHTAVINGEEEREESQFFFTATIESSNTRICYKMGLQ